MSEVYKINQGRPTIVEFILDKSGSMNSCRDSTIEGFNSYIDKLKESNSSSTMVGLTQFDSCVRETRLERTFFSQLDKIPRLDRDNFSPRGGTPLYDAVGQVIKRIEEALEERDDDPNILLVIMTDGGNTDHHGYNSDQVKDMLGTHETDGWTVVYLGANQDAWSVGESFGICKGNTMSYNTDKITETFDHLAASTVLYAGESVLSKGPYVTRSFFSNKD